MSTPIPTPGKLMLPDIHRIEGVERTPVTVLNFESQLRDTLRRYEGIPNSSQSRTQIYQAVTDLTTALMYTSGWVPGDLAGFWYIDVAHDEENPTSITVHVLPAVLRHKDVVYTTDEDTVTATLGGFDATASSYVAAQIALARVLLLREQLALPSTKEEAHQFGRKIADGFIARVTEHEDEDGDEPRDEVPAESADDKFLTGWTGEAKAMYEAYGSSVGMKNFRGDPMPTWLELPRRIKCAWCFAAEAAENYDGA